MKIIPKLQLGGSFDSLFTQYTSIQVAQPQQASSKPSRTSKGDSDNEKGKLTEKDLFSMIKDINGLPNEMLALVTDLMNTLSFNKLTGAETDLASTYLQSLYKLKVAGLNKVRYDKVIEDARKNNTLAEPAITQSGKLLAQDSSGKLGEVSLETYHKNPENYKVLSVSLVANMRAYDPRLRGDLDVFNIIDNSMSYENFLKLLKEGIASLGKSITTRNGMNFAINYEDATKAIQLLAMLPDEEKQKVMNGIIEGTSITENSYKLIQLLTAYLQAILPERAKTWASYKLGIDKQAATKNLVLTYLTSLASDSSSLKYEYNNYLSRLNLNIKDNKTEKKEKDSVQLLNQNISSKFVAGYGTKELFEINPGSSRSSVVQSNTMPLTDRSGNYLGSNSTLQLATQGDYAGTLIWRETSMGGNIINPALFGQVVLTDGKVSSVDFPSTTNAQGKRIPLLSKEVFDKKIKVEKELKQRGIDLSDKNSIAQNYQIVNLTFKRYGLDPNYTSDGTCTNWTRFAVINASTDGRVLGENFNRNTVEQITDDYELQSVASIIKTNNKDYKFSLTNWGWWGDELFKGTVWIPIDPSQQAAMAKEKYKVKQGVELEGLEEAERIYNRPSYLN